MSQHSGFLNLNKPAGFTSHDCVAKLRRILQMKKIGHGGTLDPSATGVLPIAVGKTTRLLQFLPEEKAYRARIRLGVKTTTDDLEGEILESRRSDRLTLAEVIPHLDRFIGKIEQIPPAYSAIQRGGKRMYELARAGEKVEVPKRIVEVSRIEVLNWYPGEFPELEVEIACGTGTYIRAIARDLGNALGVGGTLANLVRTLSCGMELSQSLSFTEIEQKLAAGITPCIAPDFPLQHLQAIGLSTSLGKRWCLGQKISLSFLPKDETSKYVRVYRQNLAEDKFAIAEELKSDVTEFLGIAQLRADKSQFILAPKIVLVQNSEV